MKKQKREDKNNKQIKATNSNHKQLNDEELQEATGGNITDLVKETVACPTPVR